MYVENKRFLVQIFLEAKEPGEFEVVKRTLYHPNTVLGVVYLEEKVNSAKIIW